MKHRIECELCSRSATTRSPTPRSAFREKGWRFIGRDGPESNGVLTGVCGRCRKVHAEDQER